MRACETLRRVMKEHRNLTLTLRAVENHCLLRGPLLSFLSVCYVICRQSKGRGWYSGRYNSPWGYGIRATFLAPATAIPCHCRTIATETRDAATQENLRGPNSGRQQQRSDWGGKLHPVGTYIVDMVCTVTVYVRIQQVTQ